jgi:uncharacterized membrane protein YidH (DUF202 family)
MNASPTGAADDTPVRPPHVPDTPVPPIPQVGETRTDPSTVYSHFRTELSTRRTGLSEHRTQLSEYRTDLSKLRTTLSQARTRLSENRTEMSMRRTGMSFQRTRLSAERTLMSFIRTSLSMIGFGFTIYQILKKMVEANIVQDLGASRHFGTALVGLGVLLLIGGIAYHLAFMRGLRDQRAAMHASGLLHAESGFPISLTVISALLLLLMGLVVIFSIMLKIGPLA